MVLAHTFSIVARCRDTGALGVAVASAVPAVGGLCSYLRTRVGAVSTQSWVNPYLALATLSGLEAGLDAKTALDRAVADDDRRDIRQIGVVDAEGRAAAWTGEGCTEWRGHRIGRDHAVQGNMLTGAATLQVMAETFEGSAGLDLADRLLLCLEVGEAAGGDKRGKQSAAIRVHDAEDYPLHDLRCDEHPQPVAELRRIFGIARLQLLPFVRGMPQRDRPAGPLPDDVSRMLLLPPPLRPGGGGS